MEVKAGQTTIDDQKKCGKFGLEKPKGKNRKFLKVNKTGASNN
jgi:hypothetical protein